MANTEIADLFTLGLHHFSDYIPDEPGDKGDNNLDDGYNEPQNGHNQETDKLQKRKIENMHKM